MRIARQSSKGTCSFCNGSFAKSSMSRHLKACKRRKDVMEGQAVETPGEILLHLQVEGLYSPIYWLHIEVPAKATLKALDRFLRDIWLECCGHLSSFEIAGKTFLSERMEPGDRSMNFALAKVVAPGMKFQHIYDFGTSTELLLNVISAREASRTARAYSSWPETICLTSDAMHAVRPLHGFAASATTRAPAMSAKSAKISINAERICFCP